ncbi:MULTISPECIES: adenylate/guanylate cyclase domain-containing protein [unclassified Nostoc]|uniref:adenylate/guanylate cyclase domain-containing protein n=1 Tax=unclassified Nostoc TaxID=2593658 RepID=UPI002AD2A284|nr:adenylate/guanylate cyclase domain-containing protein [Nostoc sp. DedQUE03]MDZ7976404.1 adenylate/guanylate cyclase domain-containing protein [Nostoc sp. DedQUE03]MDZ8047575.1 adenylate/guanylate cyclase domain-containing protein [Nostoc sp. DedQUE02]
MVQSLISRIWDSLLRLLLQRITLVLTIMLCGAIALAISNMSALSSSLIESQAVQNAALNIQSLTQAFDLYSAAAVQRAKAVPGITVTHSYLNTKGAIPLPSTFAIELGEQISEKNTEMSVRLYSNYPYPWRKTKGGARDAFERDALNFLRENPRQKFYRLEKQNGNTTLRYAQASLMKPSCVTCHNTDPTSPKKNWEVGDVAGAWQISQSLDNLITKTNQSLQGTFAMLGGISVLGLSGLTLVVGKLRENGRNLEHRVRERTTDLAEANTELEKRNQLIRQVFGRYLSDTVVANLLESPERLQLGGERRKITILTSDLRGFTALSERFPPEEVIHILNVYLEYMADVINHYQGTIDEFMGDGILVLFGAPIAKEDDALRAVTCACAMQLAMGGVNEKMKTLGWPPLEMGIGINTGEVIVGNIGSEKRTKYGIVGSQVNLTYRIESYTSGGQILISEQTFKEVESSVKIIGQKQVQPKGVSQPITIYEVYGVGGRYNLYLPKEEEIFFPVPQEIPLLYTILHDKQMGNAVFSGRLIKLSAKGAELQVDIPHEVPPKLTNIKINLFISQKSTQVSEDIYAKVLEKLANTGSFYIHFTSIPPTLVTQLDNLYKMISQNPN